MQVYFDKAGGTLNGHPLEHNILTIRLRSTDPAVGSRSMSVSDPLYQSDGKRPAVLPTVSYYQYSGAPEHKTTTGCQLVCGLFALPDTANHCVLDRDAARGWFTFVVARLRCPTALKIAWLFRLDDPKAVAADFLGWLTGEESNLPVSEKRMLADWIKDDDLACNPPPPEPEPLNYPAANDDAKLEPTVFVNPMPYGETR